MTVRLFRSTMANSLVVQGSDAGSVTDMLDACLVNGFTATAVSSMTRSGTTVTVNSTAHGFSMADPTQGRRAVIAGANETDYNGEYTVTSVPSANQFTFEIATTPASPATGTITAQRPSAGWSIVFTATDKRVYRAPAGNRFYLRVDDTYTALESNTLPTRFIGYETMTGVDTGTNAFPASDVLIPRSNTTGAGARGWTVLATDKNLILLIDWQNNTFATAFSLYFGDFTSYKAGDAYNTIIMGNQSQFGDTNAAAVANIGTSTSPANGVSAGNSFVRSYTQIGTRASGQKVAFNPATHNSGYFDAGIGNLFTYPSPVDGGLYMTQPLLAEANKIRGLMDGVYFLWHVGTNFAQGDTFAGAGALAGKEFFIQKVWGLNGAATVALEVSDTW